VRGTDGQIHAVELRLFPESMRGGRRRSTALGRKTGRHHDNATVGTVSQMTDGGIFHVVYKGGESEYVVG
jgi:hypothetical protein